MIKLVVGDDHEMLRRGLSALIDAEDDLRVVGQGGTVGQIRRLATQRVPDIVLTDVRLPDGSGIDLCRDLRAQRPEQAVVLYTAYEDMDSLEQALDAGARGYLLKSGPPQSVVHALRLVAQGHDYIDPALAPKVLHRREQRATSLSVREREVLELLSRGRTTAEAASQLFLSPATVRSYAESAMGKLQASNRAHAVAQALRMELIS